MISWLTSARVSTASAHSLGSLWQTALRGERSRPAFTETGFRFSGSSRRVAGRLRQESKDIIGEGTPAFDPEGIGGGAQQHDLDLAQNGA